ncbi:MAG: hypothetical protein P1S60_16490 [Anaerolineae bacterium]|nr:hypothetical protein [Anaerolineae bacterium]
MSTDKKIAEDFTLDENIKEAMLSYADDNKLTCAQAHSLAGKFEVSPLVIGHSADVLSIRLVQCQLGLYGYPGKKGWDAAGVANLPEPEAFITALKASVDVENGMNCLDLWHLAASHNISRMQAGYIAEKAGIRIMNCQLGAF